MFPKSVRKILLAFSIRKGCLYYLCLVWITLGLSGCTRSNPLSPTPTLGEISQLTPILPSPSPSPSLTPSSSSLFSFLPLIFREPEPQTPAGPAPTPTLTPILTPSVTSPPTVTPTPCSPPSGWVLYTVQSGDTLFELAVLTQTTVQQIKTANCLTSDLIRTGEKLYLPFIPVTPSPTPVTAQPPTETLTPTPTQTEVVCASAFSCSSPFPMLEIVPGGPNDPNFVPCQNVLSPRIEFDSSTRIVEIGQRRYFYVCVPNPVSANITDQNGQVQTVPLLEHIPNPDLKEGDMKAVIDWPALPTTLTGTYTMTVTSNDVAPVLFTFIVQQSTEARILTVPPAGPPGTIFQVYYVHYEPGATLTFDLFGEDEPLIGGVHFLTYRASWPITMNVLLADGSGMGWAQAPLISVPSDPLAGYAIAQNGNACDSTGRCTLFWLR